MNKNNLLDDVTAPLRKFLCKLHGLSSDHNYEPISTLLFPGSTNDNETLSEQEIVNLIWIMLEELRHVLEASNCFPKQMKQWMDVTRPTRDKNVQTDLAVELADSEFVQITCDSEEFNRRINAFIKRKRAQADAFNRREFCKARNDDDSCARTDAVFVNRRSKKSLLRIERVYNDATSKEKAPLSMENNKSWPPTHPSNALPFSTAPRDIKERILNLQSVIGPNKPVSRFSEVYSVLRDLESKVMYLETLSPEYFRLDNNNIKRKRKAGGYMALAVEQSSQETDPDLSCDNSKLLDSRIEELKRRLKESKSKT